MAKGRPKKDVKSSQTTDKIASVSDEKTKGNTVKRYKLEGLFKAPELRGYSKLLIGYYFAEGEYTIAEAIEILEKEVKGGIE